MNKTRKILLTTAGILTLLHATAQNSAIELSLKKAVTLALENSHNLQVAELEIQKAIFQKNEHKSKLLPQVDGYSNFSHYYAIPKMIVPGEIFGQPGNIPVEFGTQYDWNSGIKFSQLIYNRGYFTSIKLLTELIGVNELDLTLQKEEMAHSVSQLYLMCINIARQIDAVDSTLSNMERLIQIIHLQSENGIARPVDKERVKMDVNNLGIEKEKMLEMKFQQVNLLKLLTGIEPDTEIHFTGFLENLQGAEMTNLTGSHQRTELLFLEKQIEIKNLETRIERQYHLPTLAAFGQHYYQAQRDKLDFFETGEDKFYRSGIIGLSLSIPIFDGLEKRNRIKRLFLEGQQLGLQKEKTELSFAAEYDEAFMSYRNSLNAYQIKKENLEISQNIYNANLLGYQQQVVSLTDLIISENQMAESRMSLNNALLELRNIELKIKRLQGKILNN